MKNIVVFVLIFCLLFFCSAFEKNNNFLLQMYEEGQAEFFVLSFQENLPEFAKSQKSGNGYFITCDLKLAKYLLKDLKNVAGVTIKTNGEIDKNLLNKLQIKILKTEEIYGRKIVYGFSNFFDQFVFMQNKKVNLQIVENNGKLIIGNPIIFGSY